MGARSGAVKEITTCMVSTLRLLRSQCVYKLTRSSLHVSSWLAAGSTVATSPTPLLVTPKRNPAEREARQPKPTLKTESLLEKSPLHDFLDEVESLKDVITLTKIEYYKSERLSVLPPQVRFFGNKGVHWESVSKFLPFQIKVRKVNNPLEPQDLLS